MQTTRVPEAVMRKFLSPPVPTDSAGRARIAPLGLRRIESALLQYANLAPEDVVCTTPESLGQLVGPWVKLLAFSSSDPLGRGMSNTTTTSFWKGELYTKRWTRSLLQSCAEHKKKYGFKIVAGGGGAWQLANRPYKIAELGIDTVFEGYFESAGVEMFKGILEGKDAPEHFVEKAACAAKAAPLKGATCMGVIELSRGCGKGCSFCLMARQKMEHLEPDTILSDLQTNRSMGVMSAVSSSEDFFRYGAKGLKPDFDLLCGLLTRMREIEGLFFMQIDHGNISSILQFTSAELREIRRLLNWSRPTDYLWVNMGLESANGLLVEANCPGKIAPFRAQDWEQMVLEAAARMTSAGFFPVFSLVLGLPGETVEDVKRTLDLVKQLGRQRAVVFPIFNDPPVTNGSNGGRFTLKDMRPEHLQLYRACYEINFREVPRLIWDNQSAGGVSLVKRAALRVLGKGEVSCWRRTFRRVEKQVNHPSTQE